jgi:hypothetical protein
MTDEKFEALMRDAAHSFRRAPEPDLDEMWVEIEAGLGDARHETRDPKNTSRVWGVVSRVFAIAATLVIGIAVGRYSTRGQPAVSPPTTRVAAVPADSSLSAPYDVETSRYLGQTAALLIALPSEVRAGRADDQFVGRASELLTRTRLLIDSPAAQDTQMRNLLEDLELVLAQIVRLQNNQSSRTELDLINRALEQRDVIPRLRTAVADISAN